MLDSAVPTPLRRSSRNTDSSNGFPIRVALGGWPSPDGHRFECVDCAGTWVDCDTVIIDEYIAGRRETYLFIRRWQHLVGQASSMGRDPGRYRTFESSRQRV